MYGSAQKAYLFLRPCLLRTLTYKVSSGPTEVLPSVPDGLDTPLRPCATSTSERLLHPAAKTITIQAF